MGNKATAIFDGNDLPLQQTVRRIDKTLLGLEKKFAAVGKFAATMLAAPAAALGAAALGIGKALDTGGGLSDMANQTGIAAGELQKLQQEFKLNGKEAGDVGAAVNKMQKAIASGSADAMLTKMGLTMEQLREATPTEQFHAIGGAINGIADPAQRAAAAMEIFGKSGGSMLAMFASGSFGDAAAQVGMQAELMNKDAALFDDVSVKLALIGLKVQGFFVGVADKVAPVLKPLLDQFATMDFAPIGQELGQMVAFVIQAFSDGKLGEIIGTSLKISALDVVNFYFRYFRALGAALWQILKEDFTNAVTLLKVVTTGNFWAGMGNALMGIARSWSAVLLEGVAMMLEKLAGVPVIGEKFAAAASAVRGTAADLASAASDNSAAASDSFAPVLATVSDRMQTTFANIGKAFTDSFNSGSDAFSTAGLQDQLGSLVDGVLASVDKTSAAALAAAVPAAADKNALPDLGNAAVSSLQRIGGLGAGGVGGDPLLSENRTQTSLLRDIRTALQSGALRGGGLVTAVFGNP